MVVLGRVKHCHEHLNKKLSNKAVNVSNDALIFDQALNKLKPSMQLFADNV